MNTKQQNYVRSVVKAVVLASAAFGLVLADLQPSFAGCEARCKAAQAAGICNSAMNQKGLKGEQRRAEFQKCKMDPYGYK
jgi:hypothetical protein